MPISKPKSLRALIRGSAYFCIGVAVFAALVASADSHFARYLQDTQGSLECLRASPNGLIADKGVFDPSFSGACPLRIIHSATTPTNVALDLLVQAEAGQWARVDLTLKALEQIPRMPGTLLFFNSYSTDGNQVEVLNDQVSAVDNFHLALALWSLSRLAPDPARRARAANLVGPMNFSSYYDNQNGLLYGNLQRVELGRWQPQSWHYGDLGSEGRSLYTAGFALGFFAQPDFLSRAFKSLHIELSTDRKLMHLWDGGAFQLFLPELLLSEQEESPTLRDFFRNTSDLLVREGTREGDPLPAAYSACQLGSEEAPFCDGLPCYNGQAGLPALVSGVNPDFQNPILRQNWDIALTAHALFLAARSAPDHYTTELEHAESLGQTIKFYHSGLGYFDTLFTKGTNVGHVVPAVLALDQAIIAIAAQSLLNTAPGARAAQSYSARALRSDTGVASRLAQAYQAFDAKIAETTSHDHKSDLTPFIR